MLPYKLIPSCNCGRRYLQNESTYTRYLFNSTNFVTFEMVSVSGDHYYVLDRTALNICKACIQLETEKKSGVKTTDASHLGG